MSYDQVKNSGAPKFLIDLLDRFPFDGRKNVLQIRPQNFRDGNPSIDGNHWHSDYNVRLLGDRKAYAKDHDEFHLMAISWGAGCSTEFIETPMELHNNLIDWNAWDEQLNERLRQPYEAITVPKGQMMEYTARDLHRADGVLHSAGLRLMIVAFDCDDIEGNIRILPSIKDLDTTGKKREPL